MIFVVQLTRRRPLILGQTSQGGHRIDTGHVVRTGLCVASRSTIQLAVDEEQRVARCERRLGEAAVIDPVRAAARVRV